MPYPTLATLAQYCDSLLEINRFTDYCPHGVHIDCAPTTRPIHKLALSVSASHEAALQAIAWGADALLVHHGYFWKNEARPITGLRYQRIGAFMNSGMGLIAYHLPLDAHPEVGNNACLAQALSINIQGYFGEANIGLWGRLPSPMMICELETLMAKITLRPPQIVSPPTPRPIHTVALCSGGAQSYFEEAIHQPVDAFITGEISEPSYHLARESGVYFIAAGHHATERFGVKALGAHLAKAYNLSIHFFDSDNPV